MYALYRIDVYFSRRWYALYHTTSRAHAQELYNKEVEDDAFDDVRICIETTRSVLLIQSKKDDDNLPW